MKKIKRSPFFYVGDKFKLMQELREYFPLKVKRFIEPFTGGGTVFLNVNAEEYLLNDMNINIRNLHEFLLHSSKDVPKFFKEVHETIIKYNLSRSFFEEVVPKELQKKWKKTFYAQFNKQGYLKMRQDYNGTNRKDALTLYLLLIYGFIRMLRFNSKGEFNLPVGNVDFNNNVVEALKGYFDYVKNKNIRWFSLDFYHFINQIKFDEGDFIYLDPPYLISYSEYNKLWNIEKEKELLALLDKLNERKIKFAISNIVSYKGRKNVLFKEWMKQYKVFKIKSNYISYHDNSNKEIMEVLVTNYEPEKAKLQTIAVYNNSKKS